MKVLLVEPAFPVPKKSRNHKNFLPIGLLKLASYLKADGHEVKLIRGTPEQYESNGSLNGFYPDEVWVTSLFTYWAEYVRDSIDATRKVYPNATFKVGGIYASLFKERDVIKYTGCDSVHQGVVLDAERYFPDYELLGDQNGSQIDYQIVHTSRGCPRRCSFCGTWKIEKKFVPKHSIKNEIIARKVVFYDNNFLHNPHIGSILEELIELKKEGRIASCESQSGFDGRILKEKQYLARKLKEAGFIYPRIAWDSRIKDYKYVKSEIDLLQDAGYSTKDVFLFMLYNWDINFKEMEEKRMRCFEWEVQISDCRYRPLTQLFDHYVPLRRNQTNEDYYIHESAGWSDLLVKQFRRNVREQNICIRQGLPFYSHEFEAMSIEKDTIKKISGITSREKQKRELRKEKATFWYPDEERAP